MSVSSPQCNLHCKGSWISSAENYTANPPLLVDTPYRLASVTKPFTALTVLKLVEQGIVDVNGSVTDYLPDWAVTLLETMQGAENASQITPWMLMHHIGGVPDHSADPRYIALFLNNPELEITHRGLLEWAAEYLSPVALPGTEMHYSDTGYVFLGALIIHMTGKSLAAAVREAAHLDGLCMRSTWWEIMEDEPAGLPPRAGQYFDTIDTTNVHGSLGLYGGAGLISNAEDMAKFARAVHRGHLLGEAAMAMLYTTVPTGDVFLGREYGCGWVRDFVAGQEAWYHQGAFGTWMYYLPKWDLAVTGALNQNSRLGTISLIVTEVVQNVLNSTRCS